MQLSDLVPTIEALKVSIANSQAVLDTLTVKSAGATERTFFETSGKWLALTAADLASVVKSDMVVQQASLDKYQALYDQLQEILAGQAVSV